jgi:hypothetical protein
MIDQFAAMGLQRGQGAHLVGTHEPAVSNNIGGENGCKPTLDVLLSMGLSQRAFAKLPKHYFLPISA